MSSVSPKGVADADVGGESAVGDAGSAEMRGEGDERQEERKPRRVADPMKPSVHEVEEHELTHLPRRSWCWACVHGRGREAPRRRSKGERHVPERGLRVRGAEEGGRSVTSAKYYSKFLTKTDAETSDLGLYSDNGVLPHDWVKENFFSALSIT